MTCVTVVTNVTDEVCERFDVPTPRCSRRIAAAALAAATVFAVPTTVGVVTGTAAAATFPVDHLGRPTPEILNQIEQFADQPGMPEQVKDTLLRVVGFFRGTGEPGAPLPENGPVFTQFGWPTAATDCIGGSSGAVGTAIAVPGPAPIPLPGVPAGQTAFVFTALGTGGAAREQTTSMQVNWLNISTGAMGQTPLHPGPMNPEGPGTVNGLAETGPGDVVAVLSGGLTTNEDTGPANCEFAPTIGLTHVP